MSRICFPHHVKGNFGSLNEAVRYLKNSRNGWNEGILCKIVQYNPCYRDHLREFGLDSLISRLTKEAPGLDKKSLFSLGQWWNRVKHIAAYDIQCCGVRDSITVLGHTFNGLEDVSRHREIIGKESYFGFKCFSPEAPDICGNIHIGELYDNYPVFDSSDLCDDRTYQNYIFRKKPITKTDMEDMANIPHGNNFCMVHEDIPEELLPVLYYAGDGEYMLLATAKELSEKPIVAPFR